MDLFIINRYREEDAENIDLISQETKHLQQLKQKIEERKRKVSNVKKSDIITIISRDNEEIKDIKNNEIKVDITPEEAPQKDICKDKDKKNKSQQEFKVLGINEFEKKSNVQRVLPYWLSHPIIISTNLQDITHKVEDQNWLNDTLKATLINENVNHLFPVQQQVIPFILNEHEKEGRNLFWPHDICVSVPTGSGKTLAFVLPIIQILINSVGHHIRALVVLPVQELAAQVAKVFRKYCTKTGLKVALLSGSIPLQQEQHQIVKYSESLGWTSEVDIIVCTAGRLVEHIQNTTGFSLKHLKFLVIDEADKIMDHIQNDWLYHMDRHIKLENELMGGKITNLCWSNISEQKPPPHKLLFSATLSQDPEKLEQWGLFQPKLFSAAPINKFEDFDSIRTYTTPMELKEQFVTCQSEEKPLILYHFLFEQKWDKVLCFTNSSQSAHRLTILLNTWSNGKLQVAELSAALDRSTRETVLKKFTQSVIKVLIVTDALARGIDIPDCNYVISYDPPRNIKTYIHRVGRTGRAGREGLAITILLDNQVHLFKELIQSGGKSELPQLKIESEVLKKGSQDYFYAIQETKKIIQNEISFKVQKSIEVKRGFKAKKKKLN